MIPQICEMCGKAFLTWAVRIRKGHGRFCSRQCGYDSHKKPKTMHSEGYVMVKMPEHPRTNPWGFVYEHILVAEAHGKILAPGEIVHHKNHNRADNRFENLEFMTNSEHMRHHMRLRSGLDDPEHFKKCPRCKIIKNRNEFSPTTSRGRAGTGGKCRPCAATEQRERRKHLRALSI